MDTNPQVIAALNKIKASSSKYVLGVDVGGTNTRVAVGSPEGEYVIVCKFLARTLPQLKQGLEKLAESIVTHMGHLPDGACIAVAGPVSDGGFTVEVTNYEGSAEERTFRVKDLPSNFFNISTTRFVNDLESCCYGILALDGQNMLGDFFSPLWTVADPSISLKPAVHHAVLAAGTGFGVGMLIKLGPQFQVYPIEYGHVLIPPLARDHPDKELDDKLLAYLGEKLYQGKNGPEYEDVVSGRGLMFVYEFLIQNVSDYPSGLSAAEIVLTASDNPPNKYALRAIEIHYRMVMRAAQNVAAGLQAKGLFLAGDNQVMNDPFVRSLAPALQQEFLNHPKKHWIEQVPVFAQHKTFSINLFGTLFVARSLALQATV